MKPSGGLRQFDFILMDQQMPNMDGFAATKAIRAAQTGLGYRTPIVALAANVFADERARCLAAGLDETDLLQ